MNTPMKPWIVRDIVATLLAWTPAQYAKVSIIGKEGTHVMIFSEQSDSSWYDFPERVLLEPVAIDTTAFDDIPVDQWPMELWKSVKMMSPRYELKRPPLELFPFPINRRVNFRIGSSYLSGSGFEATSEMMIAESYIAMQWFAGIGVEKYKKPSWSPYPVRKHDNNSSV